MLKIGLRQPFLNKLMAICVLTLFGATAATARDASEIFKVFCALCHGKEGEGKRVLGPPLKGNEFITNGTDVEIKVTIKDGRSGAAKKYKEFAGPMPAQKAFNDDELDALVKYLKDLNSIPPLNAEESLSPPLAITPEQSQEETAEKEKEFDFKDLIGKEFTFSPILKDKKVQIELYYESLSDFKSKKMPLKVPFTLTEVVPQGFSQYYKIKFKSGKEGYIDAHQLVYNRLIEYKCSNCESVGSPYKEFFLEFIRKKMCNEVQSSVLCKFPEYRQIGPYLPDPI